MKKVVKIKAGEKVPTGGIFLCSEFEREFSHVEVTHGIIFVTERPKYKYVMYFYYEIAE